MFYLLVLLSLHLEFQDLAVLFCLPNISDAVRIKVVSFEKQNFSVGGQQKNSWVLITAFAKFVNF